MSASRLRGLALDVVLWMNGQGERLRAGEEPLTLARQATLGDPSSLRVVRSSLGIASKRRTLPEQLFIIRILQGSHTCREL